MWGDTEGYRGDSEGDMRRHMGDHGWSRGRYGSLREEHLEGGHEWDTWVGHTWDIGRDTAGARGRHGEGLERTRE